MRGLSGRRGRRVLLQGWLLLLVSLGYLGVLFCVAWYGDRHALYPSRAWLRPVVYSLALGVYCTAWTFYASVGSVVTSGWYYLTIYVGPILLLLFGHGLYARLLRLARAHNVTSIADFIGARYSKSAGLAMLVTFVALVAMLPYVALQYRAVAFSVRALLGPPPENLPAWAGDTSLYAALVLALFAALFGTRKVDATEHHQGLMLAVALESLVKLVAFSVVAWLAWKVLPTLDQAQLRARDLPLDRQQWLAPEFWLQGLLAALGFFCLPRQFQVGVIECADPRDLRWGRWVMIAYLALFAVLVLPIAVASTQVLRPTAMPTDALVLWLTQVEGGRGITLVAYLGGLAAASGMVLVVSVATATMVSNELVMPLLSRVRRLGLEQREDLSRIVLWIRRITIGCIALGAYAYARSQVGQVSLATLGFISMVAVVQIAPALLGGLWSRRPTRLAAATGLVVGMALWAYTLFLPSMVAGTGIGQDWLQHGPFGLALLRPQALLVGTGLDPITHGLLWSLGANLLVYVGLSRLRAPQLHERLWADAFLARDTGEAAQPSRERLPSSVRVVDLEALMARIVGNEASTRALDEYRQRADQPLPPGAPADRGLLQHVERTLAGALGTRTARVVLASALHRTGVQIEQVMGLLDVTGQELRASRRLLEAMMENVSHGISVADADRRLAAWNRRYQELFDYPPGMLYVGRPIADLIRYNVERGELGALTPEQIDAQIRKRESHMASGSAYRAQRMRRNGQVLESRGMPMPGGGYVTTFTDVTDYKRVESELRALTGNLEARVAERTAELEQALEAQRRAKQEAQVANVSKNRLLAAASHDLLQPMNAARLFVSALRDHPGLDAQAASLAERVDASLRAAEDLLDSLLGLSRLESGALTPDVRAFALQPFLEALAEQFAPLAARRGLQFRVHAPPGLVVSSDRKLLLRVAQNLIGNALRYTARGGVLVGVRRRGDGLQLLVADTGPGIAQELHARIFEEFSRVEQASPWGEKGMGLGLNICVRIARLLEAPLTLRSTPGRGSVFALGLRLATVAAPRADARIEAAPRGRLAGLRVLCLDNDPEILHGMQALLVRWGVQVQVAQDVEQAQEVLRCVQVDAILADYQLDDGRTSLDALPRLAALSTAPVAIIAADPGEAVERDTEQRGIPLLRKPVKPAMLRAWLAALPRRSGEDAQAPA